MSELKNRVILVTLGTFFGIIVIETLLFMFDLPHFYKTHSYPPQFTFFKINNELAYVNLPSQQIRFIYDGNPRGYFGKDNEVNHVTNSSGFRGNEFSASKPGDTFRIVFIGDSFTFGEGVRFADTYPELVSALLKQKYKSMPIRFESYNFGVGGYNTSQSLYLLKNIAVKTEPDLVVLGYTLNDAEQPLFVFDETAATVMRRPRENDIPEGLSESFPPDNLIYKLRLSKLIWQSAENKKRTEKTITYYKSLFRETNPGWRESKYAVSGIIKFCQNKQLPCYIILFPILYQLNNRYPFSHIHALIRREAEADNALFVDLFPYLKGKDAKKLWVHPADQHPNEYVHRIAAEALVKEVLSNTMIKEKIQSIINKDTN